MDTKKAEDFTVDMVNHQFDRQKRLQSLKLIRSRFPNDKSKLYLRVPFSLDDVCI